MNYTNILAEVDLCTSEAGYRLFGFTGYIINFIQIAVPIIIILFGTIDLVKAMIAQSPDQTKKAQNTFVKRLIVGLVIFFVPMIVMFLINMVNGTDWQGNVCLQSFSNPKAAMEKADSMKKKNVFGGTNVDVETCRAEGGTPITDEVEQKLYGFTCIPNPIINLNSQVQPAD